MTNIVPLETHTITATGLNIHSQLDYTAWCNIGKQLLYEYNALKWCLADWLAYGEESHFSDEIDQFIDEIWSTQTQHNYASTARRIPQAVRRVNVSFTDHSEVASLDPEKREYALDQLESKAWNREALREYKRSLKADTPKEEVIEITLQWDGRLIHGLNAIGAKFTKPADEYEIIGFKAIVKRKAQVEIIEAKAS